MLNPASGNLGHMQQPKKLYLEFVRGTVAIFVFITHIIELLPTNDPSNRFLISFVGTDSVMIFFLLSGCVINISQTRKPKSKINFLINRIIRLYPQFILGVGLGLIVLYILKMPPPSIGKIAGNIFMLSTLQGYIAYCIQTNSPIWTLTFEMFFYILFFFSIGENSKRKISIWFLVAMISMPLYYLKVGNNFEKHFIIILAFSSIWLVGYFVYEYRKYFYAGPYAALLSFGLVPVISRLHIFNQYYDPFNYLLFAIMAVPFFRFCLQTEPQGFKIKIGYIIPIYPVLAALLFFNHDSTRLSSKILYTSLPLILVLFYFIISTLNLKERATELVNKIGAVTGKYSYSLYIIHFPILNFCAAFFKNRIVYVLMSVIIVSAFCYFLESIFQPAVVKILRRKNVAQRLAY